MTYEWPRLFVGHDSREALGFHVFLGSLLAHASVPVTVTALTETALGIGQLDGSNAFTYSRFMVPALCDYEGFAIFVDGSDMLLEEDIAQLWALRDPRHAVQVVRREYQTQHPRKYIGSDLECSNADYPRKNWSSVVIWNCEHPANRVLTRGYIARAAGAHLHRFGWLQDSEIGDLPRQWNHLIGEEPPAAAALRHFTLGLPAIKRYARVESARDWFRALLNCMACAGEDPSDIVDRARSQ